MSDIKLFRLAPEGVTELEGQSVAVEKSLQQLVERHMEAFLGVRFLASEYSTGKVHGGRVDTLGIDDASSGKSGRSDSGNSGRLPEGGIE